MCFLWEGRLYFSNGSTSAHTEQVIIIPNVQISFHIVFKKVSLTLPMTLAYSEIWKIFVASFFFFQLLLIDMGNITYFLLDSSCMRVADIHRWYFYFLFLVMTLNIVFIFSYVHVYVCFLFGQLLLFVIWYFSWPSLCIHVNSFHYIAGYSLGFQLIVQLMALNLGMRINGSIRSIFSLSYLKF